MAIPLLPALVGGSAMQIGGVAGSLFTAASRSSVYGSNWIAPNLSPDISGLIAAWRFGLLTDEEFAVTMRWNGANVGYDTFHERAAADKQAWTAVLQSQWPRLDPATVASLYARGIYQAETFNDAMKDVGAHGKHWFTYWKSLNYTLTISDLLAARNRNLIEGSKYTERMQRSGVVSETERGLLDTLRFQPPPISDLIRFMVREAFDKEVVESLGYDNEYDKIEPVMEAVARALGYGSIKDAIPGRPETESYARLSWRAHWQPISPSQSYEMLHRLREPFQGEQDGVKVERPAFTESDVKRWLKIADYPPAIRDYLVKISYRVPTRREVRRLRLTNTIDTAKAASMYMDMGHNEEDSKLLADMLDKELANQSVRRSAIKLETRVLAGFKDGWIGRNEADAQLVNLYTPMVGEDSARNLSRIALDAAELWLRQDLIRKAIASIRSDYMEGAIEQDQARGALIEAGIVPERVETYLTRWYVELDRPRRNESAGKIIEYYTRRFIDAQTAYTRLIRIGFKDVDARMRIAAADQDSIQLGEQPEQKTPGKPPSQKHSTSVSRLRQWFLADLIDEQTARNRLANLGWPPNDIDIEVSLWNAQKGSGIDAGL